MSNSTNNTIATQFNSCYSGETYYASGMAEFLKEELVETLESLHSETLVSMLINNEEVGFLNINDTNGLIEFFDDMLSTLPEGTRIYFSDVIEIDGDCSGSSIVDEMNALWLNKYTTEAQWESAAEHIKSREVAGLITHVTNDEFREVFEFNDGYDEDLILTILKGLYARFGYITVCEDT